MCQKCTNGLLIHMVHLCVSSMWNVCNMAYQYTQSRICALATQNLPINSSLITNWLMATINPPQWSMLLTFRFRSPSARKVLFGSSTCYFKQSFHIWLSFAFANAVTMIGYTLHKWTFDKFVYYFFQRPRLEQVHPLFK